MIELAILFISPGNGFLSVNKLVTKLKKNSGLSLDFTEELFFMTLDSI